MTHQYPGCVGGTFFVFAIATPDDHRYAFTESYPPVQTMRSSRGACGPRAILRAPCPEVREEIERQRVFNPPAEAPLPFTM